jgi:hypothetical protein
MERNLEEYHRTIGAEIQALEDRVRYLIGASHWPTDGGYKESVFRTVLRSRIPEITSVGTGFVIFPSSDDEDHIDNSTQIDILVHSRFKPILFRDGDLAIVTPDAAQVLIEVKTSVAQNDLTEVFHKIGKVKKRILDSLGGNSGIRVGVFAYGGTGRIANQGILNALKEASRNDPRYAVDYFSLGHDKFFLFWEDGSIVNSPISGPVWHAYDLPGLAQAYMISNIVSAVSDIPNDVARIWFPIEGGKERYLVDYLGLSD